jgi:hypothetical protein
VAGGGACAAFGASGTHKQHNRNATIKSWAARRGSDVCLNPKTSCRARVENIISRKVLDEVVIYDKIRDVGTALNAFAAEVWDRCDGQLSPAAIAQALSESRPEPVDERAVWLAVDKLSRAKLLEEPIKMPPSVLGGASRREVMRLLSLGAAAAVPVVLSVNAPTMAQAASCLPGRAPVAQTRNAAPVLVSTLPFACHSETNVLLKHRKPSWARNPR